MFPELAAAFPDEPGPHRIPVFGHEAAQAGLARALAGSRRAQAYLVTGPPAIGKRTLARWFAQALACQAPEPASRPCGHCAACRRVATGAWPDLHEVPAPLRIEAARNLQHDLALAPAEGRERVAILPGFHEASAGAANSLLKTLEEPPPHVVLILTGPDPAAVLGTVRSRCRLLALRPLAPAAAAAALESGWGVAPERAQLLARLAGGRLGWAVRAAQDPAALEAREAWLADLATARGAGTAGRLALAAELARRGGDLALGLATWSAWWRDLLQCLYGREEAVVNRDRLAELAGAAARYRPAEALAALRGLETAQGRLAANSAGQLTLDVLLLELP